jgi:hypothetical protein
MRFITGEVKDPDSIYRYWVTEAESNWRDGPQKDSYEWCKEQWGDRGKSYGVWNWEFNQSRTGCYYFVKAQDMTLFLLRWS